MTYYVTCNRGVVWTRHVPLPAARAIANGLVARGKTTTIIREAPDNGVPLGECPECGHRHYLGFGVYEPCPECACEEGRETK